ncbi:MAG: hypothetical protein C4586_06620 [Anaerolineaceae bacterium]|nr:MAG: hypothetical protein C4586_06620 [Anaerolineaceae bacterium]
MRKSAISDLTIPVLLFTDGLICAFFAVFAYKIGLDPNPAWGRSRFILLLLGIALSIISIFIFSIKSNKNAFTKSDKLKTLFLLAHIWAVIFLIYAWFITFGNFTTWKNTTHYYTQLADAFGRGQLYVDVEPGKALLEAETPYSPTSRPPFNDEVWDMSLYKGKLYLYWGPVPALLITPIQLLSGKSVNDIYLVYFFLAGMLVFNSLLIAKLWRRYFENIPAWNVFICIVLAGLILPVLWSLNVPNVYEAAIGAGQFFLIGGVYFAFSAFEGDASINRLNLFLAGVFWACAVGSRAITVLSVIFLTVLTAFWIVKNLPKPINWNRGLREIVSLFIPLVIGAIAIGWYNWARFESPLEFGLRYQITIFNLNEQMNLTFQPDYFLLNLYAYIFQPFTFISRFPFIQPVTINSLFETLKLDAPKIYAGGRVSGILFYAPFLVLALRPLFSKQKISSSNTRRYRFIIYLLGGSFIISFTSILFYFFGQTRFLLDIISQITLLAIIGYWEIIQIRLNSTSKRTKYLVILANLLIVVTMIASFLLAFSSETNRMEKLNPMLMEKINSFFTIQQ